MKRITILIVNLILVSVASVYAEPKVIKQETDMAMAKSKSSNKTPGQTDKYTTSQIETNLEKLPSSYYGNDPKIIYTAIENRKRASNKDEFETTEQYQKRVEKENSLPIIGQISLDGLLSLQMHVDKTQIKYSADDSEFSITIDLDKVKEPILFDSYNVDAKTIMLIKELVSSSAYTGSNAYGATTVVNENNLDNYEAAISNYTSFQFDKILTESGKSFEASSPGRLKDLYEYYKNRPEYIRQLDDINYVYRKSIKLKANPNEAKTLKENLRVLLIGKVIKPLISDGLTHIRPTRDRPFELTVLMKYIYINLSEIWIYNQESGLIYSKFKNKK